MVLNQYCRSAIQNAHLFSCQTIELKKDQIIEQVMPQRFFVTTNNRNVSFFRQTVEGRLGLELAYE